MWFFGFEIPAIKSAWMLGASALSLGTAKVAYDTLPEQRFKRVLKKLVRTTKLYKEDRMASGKKYTQYAVVKHVYYERYGFSATVQLPSGLSVDDVRKQKEAFETMTNSEVEIVNNGRFVHMYFYQLPLNEKMNFNEGILKELKNEPFAVMAGYSKRGIELIKFESEVGGNVLISGAAGMGKSILLRQITATFLHLHGKNIVMKLINNKVVDNFPFMGIPSVEVAEGTLQAEMILDEALQVIEDRKKKLLPKGYENIWQYNEHESDKILPYVVVIDELARFSDNKDFMDNLIECIETGRYAGVHFILATQRADGREVVSPRVKDNCLTKVCFKMGTKGGSDVILGSDIAWNLPLIPGRAILYTNHFRTIQVPFMSKEQCFELIKDLKGDKDADTEGQRDTSGFRPIRANESGAN